MTEVPRVDYRAKDFATPQTPARLAALRFAIDCHAKKEAAAESRPEDDKERSQNDSIAKAILPDR